MKNKGKNLTFLLIDNHKENIFKRKDGWRKKFKEFYYIYIYIEKEKENPIVVVSLRASCFVRNFKNKLCCRSNQPKSHSLRRPTNDRQQGKKSENCLQDIGKEVKTTSRERRYGKDGLAKQK